MRLAILGLAYALVGAAWGFGLLARRPRPERPLLDLWLLCAFWPLYGPFWILAKEHHGRRLWPAQTILEAGATRLDELVPRIEAARRKVDEIESLLMQDEFSLARAEERLAAFEREGRARAAEAVKSRLFHIRRLGALRERFENELLEIDELLARLRVQGALVRLAEERIDDGEGLIEEIRGRVEGLDFLLGDDAKDERHIQV